MGSILNRRVFVMESILNSPSDCDNCAFSDTSSILTTSIQHDYSIYSSSLVSDDACNAFYLGLSGKGMHIGHLNVQGLSSKIDQIKLMLRSKANSIHIFGMSKSKLKDYLHENAFCIDGYQKPIRKDRLEGGGGIIVYIKEGVIFKRRNDLELDGLVCVCGLKYTHQIVIHFFYVSCIVIQIQQ